MARETSGRAGTSHTKKAPRRTAGDVATKAPRKRSKANHDSTPGAAAVERVRSATIPPPAVHAVDPLAPVKARPTRSQRASAEARAQEIDDVCAAWAAIVAERMAADQQFAESFELYQNRPQDLRGLFLWDQLHAAESHVALVNAVIAKHLDGRRADPFLILADLRVAQRTLAIVYAVNAFLAVLNQMSPNKPKWLPSDDLDRRMAVLALAHQTLEYALEAARIESPGDLTEAILDAAQDESVWTRPHATTDRTRAACAAAAAFFRGLGAPDFATVDEVVSLYETHARSRR